MFAFVMCWVCSSDATASSSGGDEAGGTACGIAGSERDPAAARELPGLRAVHLLRRSPEYLRAFALLLRPQLQHTQQALRCLRIDTKNL